MKKDIDKGRDGTKIAHFETTSFVDGPEVQCLNLGGSKNSENTPKTSSF